MGKMHDIRTQVDDAMLVNIDYAAKLLDHSRDSLFHYALKRVIEEAVAEAAFIQAGIDSAENEPLIPHEQMVAEMSVMIAEHRARCAN